MQGTIDSLEPSASGKSYWLVIDGEKYNATKPEFYATLNPGDSVNFEFSENEYKGRTFKRIEKLYKIGSNGAQRPAQAVSSQTLVQASLSLKTLSMDEPTMRLYSNIMGSLIMSGKVNLDNLLLAAARTKDALEGVKVGAKKPAPEELNDDLKFGSVPF